MRIKNPWERLVVFTLVAETWINVSGKNKMTVIETKAEFLIRMFQNCG